jgi:excisionase family DNA binding protein
VSARPVCVPNRSARPETISVDVAARRLGVHRLTLYAAIQRGEVPAIRVGRRQLIPAAWLNRVLAGEAPFNERSR